MTRCGCFAIFGRSCHLERRAEVTFSAVVRSHDSYPLFGYDLAQYNLLFEEKLDLFVKLLEDEPVTWSGRTRSTLANQANYPPIESGRLRTWIGVGGSPESVVRAARHGLPLTLAIIGGSAQRFIP